MSVLAAVTELVLLAQEKGGGKAAAPGAFDFTSILYPIVVVVFLYVFLIHLPQRREQKKQEEFLTALKSKDRVLLQGGIVGTILNAQGDSKFITVRIDESSNTKIKVLKSSVVRLLKDDEGTD